MALGDFRPGIPDIPYPEFELPGSEEEYWYLERQEQRRRAREEAQRKAEADPWKYEFDREQQRIQQAAEEARVAQQRQIDAYNNAEIERLRAQYAARDAAEGSNVSSTFSNMVDLIKSLAVPQPAAPDPAAAEAERIRQLVAQGDIAARKVDDSNKARLLREEENAWTLRVAPEHKPIEYRDEPVPTESRLIAAIRSALELNLRRKL